MDLFCGSPGPGPRRISFCPSKTFMGFGPFSEPKWGFVQPFRPVRGVLVPRRLCSALDASLAGEELDCKRWISVELE